MKVDFNRDIQLSSKDIRIISSAPRVNNGRVAIGERDSSPQMRRGVHSKRSVGPYAMLTDGELRLARLHEFGLVQDSDPDFEGEYHYAVAMVHLTALGEKVRAMYQAGGLDDRTPAELVEAAEERVVA